ncbi:MAG: hypothetical protein JWM96_985 [Alphaproteobacteria bacterium]|nr:hypothetical protein [Alphaproteobacteria bacterium]
MTDNIRPLAQKKSTAPGIDFCAEEVRRCDYGLYVSTLFALPKERGALFALYALKIALGRIKHKVTEPMMGLIRLQWWRDAVEKLFHGKVLHHDVLHALLLALQNGAAWQEEDFQKLIDAYEMDFQTREIQTVEAWQRHTETVALPLFSAANKVSGLEGDKETIAIIARCHEISRQLLAIPSVLAGKGKILLPNEILQILGHNEYGLTKADIENRLKPFMQQIVGQNLADLKTLPWKQIKKSAPLLPGVIAQRKFEHIKRYDYALFDAANDYSDDLLGFRLLMKRLLP